MKLLCALLTLLLAALPSVAQGGNRARCSIRLDVFYATGGPAPSQLHVKLLKGTNGSIVAVTTTNTSGTAEFYDLDPGQYQAVVSGDGIQTTTSSVIEVSDWSVFQSQTVVVQKDKRNETGSSEGSASTIQAADLNVPPKAAKEYDRGNHEIASKNWDKAIEHFNKAIEIYPSFTAAYNNLAVCFGQMGKLDEQRKVLQKALTVNEKCVPVLLNLSDMDLRAGNFNEAGSMIERALAAEPSNVEALSYQAQLDLAQAQYDLAIAAVRKAHGLPHRDFSGIHFTAASAFEREGRIRDAIAELQIFLQEAPQSPRAEAARKAIAGLQKNSQ